MAFDFAQALTRYRAVLFDVDGTIAETEGEGHLPAFNQAFAEFGIPWQWTIADYAELLKVTGGFERMCAYAQQVGDDIAATESGREKLLGAHKRKNLIYADRLKTGQIPPRKGFVELVQLIAAQELPWVIVTTTSLSNWKALWDYSVVPAGLTIAPKLAICGEDVHQKKPDPEAYVLAVNRLGLSPSQCLAIEDSRNGLTAAQGAGVDTIMVKSQFFAHQSFPEALAVVSELSDLI